MQSPYGVLIPPVSVTGKPQDKFLAQSAVQHRPTPLLTSFSYFPLALLVYRVFRKEAKRTTKILHGLLHVFAFIIALVGKFLSAAFPSLPAAPGSSSSL